MLYLVKVGVSIRTEGFIRPSIVDADFTNVSTAVFSRLFPDFQKSHYIIWGLPEYTTEDDKVVTDLKTIYEAHFKKKVTILLDPLEITKDEVENCESPCWIFLPQEQAHQLALNKWIETNVWHLKRDYITITWVDFLRHPEVPDYCIEEKHLDYKCLQLVAVREVERKFREENKRYFFMRKYQDSDFFLFVEKLNHQ